MFPRFDASLRDMCKQRTFVELEVKLVMRSLLHAYAHLHMHGLVHADVKPQNVLVKGVGLSQCRSGCISCYPKWSDADACLQFSKDVDNLPSLLEVVLGDLGNVDAGDPCDRAPFRSIEEFGVEVCSLPYRAPEVLLGDSEFTFAIDAWALGCLGVEIIQGQELFPATSQVDLLFKICTTFGSPKPGGSESAAICKHFARHHESCVASRFAASTEPPVCGDVDRIDGAGAIFSIFMRQSRTTGGCISCPLRDSGEGPSRSGAMFTHAGSLGRPHPPVAAGRPILGRVGQACAGQELQGWSQVAGSLGGGIQTRGRWLRRPVPTREQSLQQHGYEHPVPSHTCVSLDPLFSPT